MTDQQILTYQRWLYEGKARLEPLEARPGWWVLVLREGERETPVRYLGPKNAARLFSPPDAASTHHICRARRALPG